MNGLIFPKTAKRFIGLEMLCGMKIDSPSLIKTPKKPILTVLSNSLSSYLVENISSTIVMMFLSFIVLYIPSSVKLKKLTKVFLEDPILKNSLSTFIVNIIYCELGINI